MKQGTTGEPMPVHALAETGSKGDASIALA